MLSLKTSTITAALIASLFAAEYARATVVEVHQFVVMRTIAGNLGVYMNDDFNDMAPPPSTEAVIPPFQGGSPSPVAGLFGAGLKGQNCDTVCTDPGLPDGFTTMDSDTGLLVTSTRTLSTGGSIFVDQLIRSQTARFATPTTNTATGRGLKSSHEFHAIGVFRLVNPDLPRGNYGIGFTDGDNDILNLSVLRRGDTGETFVFLLRFEGTREVGVVTPIGSEPISNNFDEDNFGKPGSEFIVLRLRRLGRDLNDRSVIADFKFASTATEIVVTDPDLGDAGFTRVVPTSGVDPTIFNPSDSDPGTPEHFTRAQFRQNQNLSEAKIAELTTGSPVTLSQLIDAPANPFNLKFSYRFGSDNGKLSVSLVDPFDPTISVQLGGSIFASGPPPDNFTIAQRTKAITDPALLGIPLNLTFRLDALPGNTASVDIDNVLFPGVAEGTFSEGLDGASSWVSGGDGSTDLVTLTTPAEAVVVVETAEVNGVKFEVSGVFEAGPSSDGLNLPGEDLTVVLGDFVETFPAGSFVEKDTDVFRYEGDGGAIKEMQINVADGSFKLEGEGADLSSINSVDPASVHMLIGNDLGLGETIFEVKD